MKSRAFYKSLAILLALCLCLPVIAGYAVSAQQTEGSKVLSIDFSKINEGNKNLITKQAYPGGSTFSFDAYVPSGGSWWGVLWTTDPAVGDIYSHSSGHIFSAVADQWANYSWTLPDDGQNYYLYFCAEVSQKWADKPVLVDNFTICDASDNMIAFDGFNTLVGAGLFNANTNAVSVVDYDYHAVLDVDRITAGSVISKQAYPGGSTVTLKATVPSGGSWWGICWTTDPSNKSIYNVFSSGKSFATQADTSATYTATLPNDGNNYYIYFGAAEGEWNNKTIEMDQVTVTAANGTVLATEGFDNGRRNSIFNYDSAITLVGGEVEVANTYAAINIDTISAADNSKMSFITKEAYPGGSTVTFDAFVPSGTSWWGLCWTTDVNTNSIYDVFNSNGKNFSSQKDQWATYTATLPNDGNSYYIYVGGAKGEWGGKELLIDNVVINSPAGVTLAAEEFSAGIGNSIFNYVKANNAGLAVVTEKTDSDSTTDYAAAINIDTIKAADNSQMSFITKKAYPGGSTVTFDAYVPSDASWWGICWTTDANVNSIYNVFNSKGKNFSSQKGQWATYTATLPNDGNDYYFYIGGAKGEWHSEDLLIDNVVINGANGYTLGEEDFANGLENSIFKTDAAVSLADLTPVEPEQTDLFIGTQTKNGQTRLVMKLCADAETIEAYDSVAFKLTINGVEETIAVDCVYDSFYNNGALVTAANLNCTYVAILEIGNISGKTVTVQGVINGTEEGVARTLK